MHITKETATGLTQLTTAFIYLRNGGIQSTSKDLAAHDEALDSVIKKGWLSNEDEIQKATDLASPEMANLWSFFNYLYHLKPHDSKTETFDKQETYQVMRMALFVAYSELDENRL